VEGGILVPQSLNMLLDEGHPQTLLDDNHSPWLCRAEG
jgi:hypothetical protein